MSNTYTPGGSNGIDPATLTAMLQQLIMQGGQGGALNNLLPQDLSQLSFGFNPTGMNMLPQIPGTANARQVGSAEEMGKQLNISQDINALTGMGDLGYAGMMGPGGFSADAFAPTVTNELIPRPATQQFNQWVQNAQQGDLSFEGLIASEMQSRGISPRQAVTEMREILQNADKDAKSDQPNQALQDQANQIRLWLPNSNMTNSLSGDLITGDAAIDWTQAFNDAETAFKPYMDEQNTQPGPIAPVTDAQGNVISSGGEIVVGSDGQLYRQTTTPSPAAEQFREAGLPLPTDQYSPGDLLGAGWQQADAAFQDTQPQVQDQMAQYQSDIDSASHLATTLGQMPLQEFYDRGSTGDTGGTIAGWPSASRPAGNGMDESKTVTQAPALAPVVDTNTGIVTDANNPWPGLDPTMIAAEERQRIQLEQERIAQQENPQQSEVFWQNALASVLGGSRPAGAPQANTPLVDGAASTSSGGSGQVPYTIDPVTGQPVLGSDTSGVGGGGAGGVGAPRTLADLPGSPAAYLAGMRPHPDQYAVQSGRMSASQAQPPGPQVPPGGYIYNGAIFDSQDRLVGYVPRDAQGNLPYGSPGAQGPPMPPSPTTVSHSGGIGGGLSVTGGMPERQSRADLQTKMMLQQLLAGGTSGNTLANVPSKRQQGQQRMRTQIAQGGTSGNTLAQADTSGTYIHNGAIFDSQDRLIGYVPANQANARGPSTPTGGAVGGRAGFLAQLWPASQPQPLRYGLDTQTSPGHGRDTGKSAPRTSGPNRRDRAVSAQNARASAARDAQFQLRNQNSLADRAVHGAAYARAWGYTDALRALGITPYSVAAANRTQGLASTLGR